MQMSQQMGSAPAQAPAETSKQQQAQAPKPAQQQGSTYRMTDWASI
ncbi:hypothetical protein [Paenirhodobacter enshiensis]